MLEAVRRMLWLAGDWVSTSHSGACFLLPEESWPWDRLLAAPMDRARCSGLIHIVLWGWRSLWGIAAAALLVSHREVRCGFEVGPRTNPI